MGFFNPSGSQKRYALAAMGEQRNAYQDAAGMYQPYAEGGMDAYQQRLALAGLGGDQQAAFNAFRATPGYQSGLQEGVTARDRGAASRGMLGSGAQMKALTRFGQDYADKGFNDYWNRLGQIDQTGYNATQGTANARLGLGQQLAQGYQSIGDTKTNQNLALWKLGGDLFNSAARGAGQSSDAIGSALKFLMAGG